MTTTALPFLAPAATSASLRIGGDARAAADGGLRELVDPATGEPLARVAEATAQDVGDAVAAARRAFEEGAWRHLPGAAKARVLHRWADGIDAAADNLAQCITLEMGKPIVQAEREIRGVAELVRYYAGWTTKVAGTVNTTAPGMLSITTREPVGVCAAITPWNYPAMLAMFKLAPALACGNAVVLKPAEQTPLIAVALADAAAEAGVPPGVLNVVTGGGAVAGAELAGHPDVAKVAFTGSTDVGKQIMRLAADRVARVSLELGGKSPNVVFADADLDAACAAAAAGMWENAGQWCVAGSRLLVQREVVGEVVDRLLDSAAKLRVGPGIERATDVGPLVSEAQLARVLGYVERGRAQGATLAYGGERLPGPGFFMRPTIFTDVTQEMAIAQEEIFGPVLAVIPFDEDPVPLANATRYGLAAAVWTRDHARAQRVARELRAGMVWVNTYGEFDLATPFGGVGESGFGRELGSGAIDLFTEQKSTISRW